MSEYVFMKLDVFIFRHGETDWNVATRFQGHTDIELNANGMRQAEELALKLKPFQIPIIACSDLVRAKKTAEIVIKAHPAKIVLSDQLREAHLGKTEGMLRDDVIKTFSEDSWNRWRSAKPEDMDFGWPGGETKRHQLSRMRAYIKKFVSEHVTDFSKPLGISTHGGVLARLVHHADNSPSEVKIPNCVVYRLSYDIKNDQWIFIEQL
jgi:broad specificity phosphatase PhoE